MPPLFVVVGAWLVGVVAASRLAWDPAPLLLGVGASLFAPLLWPRRYLAWLLPVAALVVVAAFWRVGQAGVSASPELTALNGRGPVSLRGRVVREPEIRDRSVAIAVAVEELRAWDGSWQPLRGLVLVQAGRYPEVAYGDLVLVTGKPQTPPAWEGFDYRAYLARQGIGTVIPFASVHVEVQGESGDAMAAIYRMRRRLGHALATALPEPQAALAQGILLGLRSSLPPAVAESFNMSGLAHLLAVSGENVNLVAAAAMALTAGWWGRRAAVPVAIGAVGFYALLVGLVPSVNRASLMLALGLLALFSGRQAYGMLSLGLVGSLLLAWDPRSLWDVGFQLSFAATAGIVLVAPHALRGSVIPSPARWAQLIRSVRDTAVVTGAAVLATAPIMAATFHRVSLVALPANLLAAPLFIAALAMSAVTSVAQIIWHPLGEVAGWLAWIPLTVMAAVGQFFGTLPFASLPIGDAPELLLWSYYGVLGAGFCLFVLTRRRALVGAGSSAGVPRWPQQTLRLIPWPRLDLRWVAFMLGCGNLVVWLAILLYRDDRVRVYVLDVGQGDAILVRSPEGRTALIDGGPSPQRLETTLGARQPLWDRGLDLVVLTHPQSDHLAGLVEALRRHRVGIALDPQIPSLLPLYAEFRRRLAEGGVQVQRAEAGALVRLGSGTRLELLHPPAGWSGPATDPNRGSVVGRLMVGEVSFLLTGDAPADVLLTLPAEAVRALVLKVPHHGARGGLSPSLLARVSPTLAVVSVGEGNPYGHPAAETLGMLDGLALLRTDRHGTIEFATDGRRLWLRTERRPAP